MLWSRFTLGVLRHRGQRGPRSVRRLALAVEALEDRNLLSFSAPSSYQFSRDPAAVAVADFNRDGNQDLVVADDIAGTLTTLLGNGDGTFRNAGSIRPSVNSEPILAVGDFNGDGIPDLAVGNYAGVDILIGNGDGTFRNAGVVSVDGREVITTAVAVADFNGDGTQDIAITTLRDGGFEFLGNGDGTFQKPIPIGSLNDIQRLVAGDINNDGLQDLVGLNYQGQAVLLAGNGDGTFQDPVLFAPGLPLTVTDLNGDGIPDLVLPASHGISERLGNGDGSFQDPITVNLPANTPGTILGVGDFNNHGQLDVAFANRAFSGTSHSLSVLLNDGGGSFAGAPAFATGAFPSAIAAGDFNGDGRPDLVTVGYDGQAHVLLNNGDGTFHHMAALPATGIGTSVVVGDFDGDGKLDFASLHRDVNGHSQVNVFLGNGDGTFQPSRIFDLGSDTASVFGKIVAGDFDGDGRLDLAVLFHNNNSRQTFVEVLLGNGNGTFQATAPHLVSAGEATSLAVADLNGDGKLDLVVANQGNGSGQGALVSVLLGNGDGTFQDPAAIPVPGGPFHIAVGDFNGDGIPDLVTANGNTNTVSVLLGRGDGTFRAPVNYAVGVEPDALLVGDFNGDGILGVAVANSSSNTVSVLRGNGDGTLQNAVHYLVGNDPRSLVAADFNGDGGLSLAVANFHSDDISVLLNRNDGGAAPAGHAAALNATAVEAVFAATRPETPSRVSVQPPDVAAVDAAFADLVAAKAVVQLETPRAIFDADIGLSPHQMDQTQAAEAAALVDPLAEAI